MAAAAALGQKASKEDGELVNALFNSVGYCATVDEKLISAVTGTSLEACLGQNQGLAFNLQKPNVTVVLPHISLPGYG